jgi:hypothetical protein
MFISKDAIRVKPNPDFEYNVKAPAFTSFLVGKILSGMVAADEELVKEKQINEKEVFKFKVTAPEDILQEIVIKNYGDQKRVDELKNTVRWTFEKIHQ